MATTPPLPPGFQLANKAASAPTPPPGFQIASTSSNSAQQRYDKALSAVRTKYFPDMNDATFAEYAEKTMGGGLKEQANQSLTFGLADEISSGINALGSQVRQWTGGGGPGFGESFKDWQELNEARLALAREKGGPLGTAVEVGTGLMTMGPGAALMAPARVAPSLLKTAVTSGATGAGLGALGGLTSSEGNLGERAEGAAKGGLGGAVLGAALPLVARGVSGAYQNVTGRMAANDAAQRLGVDPEAARFVQTRLEADDALSPAGIGRMRAAGPEGMIADAGPSARNTLDYAIQSSGRAGQLATEGIGARVHRDAEAIDQALDHYLGQPQGINTMRTNIRQGSAPARSQAYDAAYAAPIDYSAPEGMMIEELLQRVPQEAITRANRLMRVRGERSPQIIAEVGDDGQITYRTMPDVRQLDYITRALNDEAKNGIGAGAMGGQTDVGSSLSGLSAEIRDTLRAAVPEYGQALDVAQETIRRSQAGQVGYELMRDNVTRETVAEQMAGLTAQDRQTAALGLRSYIDDKLARVRRTVMDGDVEARQAIQALKDLSAPANREKVALVIGRDAADDLFTELDRAAHSFELRASVADNSKTFQRQEMNRQVDAVTNPQGILATAGRGEPLNAGKRMVQAVTGLTPERALSAKDAMMQEVARILLTRGPQAVTSAQMIAQLSRQIAGSGQVSDRIARLGAALSGPSAYQYGRQQGANQ